MKPRPTTIQPGATHWNPNAGPDWYTNKCCSYGGWMYFDAEEGNWDQGTWRWAERVSGWVVASDLIPVEHLMAQHNGANSLSPEVTQAVSENYTARLKREIEWNGEGLPPVGTVCEVSIGAIAGGSQWVACTILAHDIGTDEIAVYRTKAGVYGGSPWDLFRPIKSEREKAIEAMSLAIRGLTYLTKDVNAIAAALFDAGYRKVEK